MLSHTRMLDQHTNGRLPSIWSPSNHWFVVSHLPWMMRFLRVGLNPPASLVWWGLVYFFKINLLISSPLYKFQ